MENLIIAIGIKQIRKVSVMGQVRHKVFISFHHDDKREVDKFIEVFDEERKVFIGRALGIGMSEDIIDSSDVDYVMRRIRELYLKDSTVTIVLIGKCTWARRYVDWEIQASLHHGKTVTPNGLLGIVLPSGGKRPTSPNRLKINLPDESSNKAYARWYWYPKRKDFLTNIIEDAYQARTSRAHLIENPRERFGYNRSCP